MYKSILVPLDGSKTDEIVLAHVASLAKALGGEVLMILLYRLAPSDDPFEKQMQLEDGSSGWRARRKAETYLPQLEQKLVQVGIRAHTEFLVGEEPEADTIVKYAEEHHCDLIVLANRERSPIGRFFFGNIEEKVRRRSRLPVLFVSVRES